MRNIPLCKNTWSQHANYHAGDTYGGYCLECSNAGVPEMEAEIERGRKALEWLYKAREEMLENVLSGKQMVRFDQLQLLDLDAILDGWKP